MLTEAYKEGTKTARAKFALLDKKKEKEEHQLKSHAAGGLAAGATLLGQYGAGKSVSKLDPAMREYRNPEAMQQHVMDLARQMNVPDVHVIVPDHELVSEGSGYIPKDHTVITPTNAGEATILHELGHARSSRTTPRLQRLGVKTMAPAALGSLGASVYALGSAYPSYIPAVESLAMHAPLLAEEAGASARALKHLMMTHGTVGGLWRGRALLPAFGTYAAFAGLPLAITAARRHFQDRNP